MINIDSDDPAIAVWEALIELQPSLPGEWTLVGGQMVALHGIEQGKASPRATTDADLVFNVRLVGPKLSDFAQVLENRGYELQGVNSDEIGHRFSNETVSFDVLAPDGVGEKVSLETIGSAHTVQVPGGTQALGRTERVAVQAGGRKGVIPRPNLLGAILVKSRAVDIDDVPEGQLQDLVFLLSLVSDPVKLSKDMKSSERTWLARRSELTARDAGSWRALSSDDADLGFATFRILSGR